MTVAPDGQQKLQVYFPHLQDTVELLQVRRVLARMETFLQLMHEGLSIETKDERRIDTTKEFERSYRPPLNDARPLKSSFPVRPEMLMGEIVASAAGRATAQDLVARFENLRVKSVAGIPIEWQEGAVPGSLIGSGIVGKRVQPIMLLLDLYGDYARVRCVSPIGVVNPTANRDTVIAKAWKLGVRIGAIVEPETASYDLTIEEDVLLAADASHDVARMEALLRRVLWQADKFEQEFFDFDHALEAFRDDMARESTDGR